MRRVAVVALPLLIVGVAGCGSGASTRSGSTSSHSASAAARNTIEVTMKNIAFNPGTVHAKVGQTITWTNQDDAPHNVTYVSGPRFASSETFTQGRSFTLRLTAPGTIRYLCTIHPGMDGTIIVTR